MAKFENLILLTRTMSKTEKRLFSMNFGLNTRDAKNLSDYLVLYNLIVDERNSEKDIRLLFRQKNPSGAFESLSLHLYQHLIRFLSDQNTEKNNDVLFNQYYSEAIILFNRSIYDACFQLINKARTLAFRLEKFIWYSQFARLELDFFRRLNYPILSEEDLVKRYTSAGLVIDYLKSIHEHTSLLDTLSYRYALKGPLELPFEKEQLNDLVLGEMSMMNKHNYRSFESRKTHLLFQVAYFKMTGEPPSALHTLRQLTKLFEEHQNISSEASLDYVDYLNELLNNLYLMNATEEVSFYIQKLRALEKESNEILRVLIPVLIKHECLKALYEDNPLQIKEQLVRSEQYIKRISTIQSIYISAEIAVLRSMLYYRIGDLKSASHCLRCEWPIHINDSVLPVYVAARMLNLVLRYERGDMDLLISEITSIERKMKNSSQLNLMEKQFVRSLRRTTTKLLKSDRKKILAECKEAINEIAQEPAGKSIRLYFDVIKWLNKKIVCAAAE